MILKIKSRMVGKAAFTFEKKGGKVKLEEIPN